MQSLCRLVTFSFVIFVTALPLLGQDKKSQRRPSFDVKKFLKRLDTNNNGKVDPSEIKDDRTREFLRKSGADPSKPISIKSYSKQQAKRKAERANPGSAQQTMGFAVEDDEREEESGAALGFAVSDEEREPAEIARTRQFSKGAKNMLEWVLNNYDKNKDGKIDSVEIKAARWADPPAHVSDTNKDGSLSKTELLIRYQKREDEKGSSSKKSSGRNDRKSRSRSSRSSSSRSQKPSSSSGSTGGRDVRKGYESYVEGIFKAYDKNKDGMLDQDEVEKMRKKPDKSADANGDKKVSKSELLESYLVKAGQGTKSTGRKSRGSKGSRSFGGGKSSGSSVAGSRGQLTSRDKNKNGQIEMSEYETDWTVEKIEAYYKIDKNRDGVITRTEWDSK